MKPLFTLLLLLFLHLPGIAQPALALKWKAEVSTSSGDDHALGFATDEEGNSYTFLAGYNILGDSNTTHTGRYFLLKMDPLGNKIWSRNFGTPTSFNAWGAMAMDNEGNLIIGASAYTDKVFYENLPVLFVPHGGGTQDIPFFLKISLNGALLQSWYMNAGPVANAAAYINNITTDAEHNIYAAVSFRGNLNIGTTKLNTDDNSIALLKFDASGSQLWNTFIHAKDGSNLQSELVHNYVRLQTYKPYANCPEQLLLLASTPDDIYVNDERIYSLTKQKESGNVLLEFREDGKFARLAAFPAGSFILSTETHKNRIYIGGGFTDSLNIGGKQLIKPGYSFFLSRLDELLNIKNSKVIAANNIAPVIIKYHPELGLVTCCNFGDFSANLDIVDSQFIRGGYVNIQGIGFNDKDIIAAATYSGACYFDHDTITSSSRSDNNVVVFRTQPFSAITWNELPDNDLLTGTPYPHPFHDRCTVRFNLPLYAYTYNVYNSIGQLCDNATITLENNTDINIEMSKLPAGLYFLHLKNCCDKDVVVKLVKL